MKKYIGLFVVLSFLTIGATKVQAMMPYYPDHYVSNNPVISGISGPQALNINETGIWKVKAYDPLGGNLSYSVDWGDFVEENNCPNGINCLTSASLSHNYQQSATFNHSYQRVGVYTVTFTVTNDNGQNAKTSMSVRIKGNIINPTFLKVLSPNGGEVWFKNTTKTISWKSYGKTFCNEGGPCLVSPRYGISLVTYNSCVGINCLSYPTPPMKIARGVYGNSYQWNVGKIIGLEQKVSNGTYRIMVCETRSGLCDLSDDYFKITSVNISTPTIIGISGPQTLRVGQTGTWQVKVKNPNEGNLSYSVDWGETTGIVYNQESNTVLGQINKQTATFSHNYTRPGNYKIKFTVTNDNGQKVSKTYKVRIRDINIWNSVLSS